MTARWHRKKGQPTWLMGVLNCTPDSFSDGAGLSVSELVCKTEVMLSQGADIIDVGGESTRPNAEPVSLEEELARVIPVIQALPNDIVISIDTMKAEVMRQAIEAGASLVNDVSALTFDRDSLAVVAKSGVDVCLMHMQGTPETMQQAPKYVNVLAEVIQFFERRIDACLAAGIKRTSIILDPGIGFGKNLEDNLTLIANIDQIKRKFALPVLLGASRKSFLGKITGSDIHHREVETAVASAIGVFNGVDMVRVHDCTLHHPMMVAAKLADYRQLSVC
ncbi:dihydropteroate synthase [Ghiorsea bivora]|uniref:dihydropteroate synthase n=1 Tax=Ghiorsea bivora TaxID=1485545 RepID=UPI000571FCBA|nr:dihydropteroate synthase [Ghiorsea bivora]